MFKEFLPRAGNPFRVIDLEVTNRTGASLAVGEVVELMLNIQADGDTTAEAKGGGPGTPTGTGTGIVDVTSNDFAPYSQDDVWAVNIDDTVAVGANTIHLYAVVTDLMDGGGGDNTDVKVRFQGPVEVNVASDTYVYGAPLMVNTSNNNLIDLAAATGNRPIGFSLEESPTATSLRVMFFGWAGMFGGQHN